MMIRTCNLVHVLMCLCGLKGTQNITALDRGVTTSPGHDGLKYRISLIRCCPQIVAAKSGGLTKINAE